MTQHVTVIDHQVCMKCSRCATVCSMGRMSLSKGQMQVTTDPLRYCFACGHCMAVCPTKAIVSAGFDYAKFEKLPDKVASLNDILPLLKSRRSMRHFQDKPVDREILQKIIDAAATAPMGVPPTSVEILVFHSREKVKEIIPPILNEFKQWVSTFGNPVMKAMFTMMMGRAMIDMMVRDILPLVKEILSEAEKGQDRLTYNAPAMMVFHGDKFTVSNKENVYIATTYAMIAAEASGLGNCWIGMVSETIGNSKKLKQMLSIPKNNEVLGCLVLGWPKVTYNKSIPREFKSVVWR